MRTIDRDVEEADVEGLVRDLEAMRAVLDRDRTALRPQLEAMIFRAERMRDQAAGSRFEKSLTAAYDMLIKLHRGPAVTDPVGPAIDVDPLTRTASTLFQRWRTRRNVAA